MTFKMCSLFCFFTLSSVSPLFQSSWIRVYVHYDSKLHRFDCTFLFIIWCFRLNPNRHYFPFVVSHTCVWFYREKKTAIIRDSIHTRYMLLPYFYTLFREANTTGVPVARPLWMEFPSDEKTFKNDEAFMVGNSILVHGIYTEVHSNLLSFFFYSTLIKFEQCRLIIYFIILL